MEQQERLLTEPQLGEFLQVSRSTLVRYRNEKVIPFYRIAGSVRYSLDEVKEALKKCGKN